MRFYHHRELVRVHPPVAPGQRHTDPAEQAACALRDRAFFERKAAEQHRLTLVPATRKENPHEC